MFECGASCAENFNYLGITFSWGIFGGSFRILIISDSGSFPFWAGWISRFSVAPFHTDDFVSLNGEYFFYNDSINLDHSKMKNVFITDS